MPADICFYTLSEFFAILYEPLDDGGFGAINGLDFIACFFMN